MMDYVDEIATRPVQSTMNLQQQALIERFIKSKDHHINPSRISQIKEDLTTPSTKISDFLLTENLAEIFLKQGKNDKAIEIYRKLIWKFPQKKAYFASQIEKISKG